MAAAKKPEIPATVEGVVVAKTTFAYVVGGSTVIVRKGDMVAAGDPVTKNRDELFEPLALKLRTFPKGG